MFCTLPQYFIGDSRIAPPSRRSPQHFSIVAFPLSSVFLSLFLSLYHAFTAFLALSFAGTSQRDNFFGRSSRNSVAQIFHPFSSLSRLYPSARERLADVVRTFEQSTYTVAVLSARDEVRRPATTPRPGEIDPLTYLF